MKRLFSLQNKVPLIEFLNAIYKDDISYKAKITYGDKEIIRETLKYIDKAYNYDKINIEHYSEMTIIMENINSYFLDMYGKYENIDEQVRGI